MRKVVIYIQEIIVESDVLLRVEDLQQSRFRVTLHIIAYLIDLIQDEHRIGRLRLLQALDDTARHSSDVGSTMSTDLRLVMQTAQ